MKASNEHEKIAMKNTKGAFDWIVGGYYNSYLDGELENFDENIKDTIYHCAMNDNYLYCGCEIFGKAPKEMRFATSKFVKEYIDYLWEKDADVTELLDYFNS